MIRTKIEIKSELEIFTQPVVYYEQSEEADEQLTSSLGCNDDPQDKNTGPLGELADDHGEVEVDSLEPMDDEDPLQCDTGDDSMEIKYPVSTSTATLREQSTSAIVIKSAEAESQVEGVGVTVKCDIDPELSSSLPSTKSEKKPPKLKKFRPAICTICNVGFPSASLYEHHMSKVHQNERPYACRHCKKPFVTKQQRKLHEKIHDPSRWQGDPQFACDICGKRYHIKYSMRLHRRKVHFGYNPPKRPGNAPIKEHHSTSGIKNPNPFRKPKQVFPCTQCDLKFNMRCELKKHMLSHTNEKPFPCPICQQPFALETQVKGHIRNVHQESTPSGMSHTRPRWQAGQPCPCEICGKVFRVPSQLRNHMYLHTGEKNHKCLTCGETFRLGHTLSRHIRRKHRPDIDSNPIKLYKCMICGKSGIRVFGDFRQHRIAAHGHIPYESEKEKPFGCVVCGKPHFLQEDAIICALLGHDPSSLLHDMFKFKCPECPPETFGFHSLAILRKHWQAEHGDKFLPVKLRKGINLPNLKANELPKCRLNRKVAQNWKEFGIPPEFLLSEDPLFTEFPLLPIPEENRFKKKGGRTGKKVPKDPNVCEKMKLECEICRLSLSSRSNLRRHMEVVHNPLRTARSLNSYKCSHCDQRFRKRKTLHSHEKIHQRMDSNITGTRGISPKMPLKIPEKNNILITNVVIKEEPLDLPANNTDDFRGDSSLGAQSAESMIMPVPSVFRCRTCDRVFAQARALSAHEVRAHVRRWSTRPPIVSSSTSNSINNNTTTSVNINDVNAVANVLNGKTARILLTRRNRETVQQVGVSVGESPTKERLDKVAEKNENMLLGNRVIKIVLERVDTYL